MLFSNVKFNNSKVPGLTLLILMKLPRGLRRLPWIHLSLVILFLVTYKLTQSRNEMDNFRLNLVRNYNNVKTRSNAGSLEVFKAHSWFTSYLIQALMSRVVH